MTERLIFSKERTMGQTISFAFLVYRHNWKNFWKGMLTAVLPWIVGSAILIVPFLIGKSQGSSVDPDAFAFIVFLSVLIYFFSFLVLNTYVNEHIIAIKNDTGDQRPHFKQVVRQTYKALPTNILNFILDTILFFMLMSVLGAVWIFSFATISFGVASGSVIIIGIALLVNFLLFWLLGSYLCACTGPIIFICQYEKVGFFKALEINFSYLHARKGFWPSILITLFGFLLMYIISINITTPVALVYGIIEYNSGSMTSFSDDNMLTIFGISQLILAITWPLSAFIMMMIFGANYFCQKERALGTGLKEKIENIGITKDYDSSKLEINF